MKNFQQRLLDAVEGHPDVPEKVLGRQKWLIDRLASVSILRVTANTAHKWFQGASVPKHNHIRALAVALGVDEAWLALGVKPMLDKPTNRTIKRNVSASLTILAEAFQMAGWQAGTPQKTEQPYDLLVIGTNGLVEIELLSGVKEGPETLYYVNEPVRERRLTGLKLINEQIDKKHLITFALRDFTNVPRRNFGGYLVIAGRFQDDGRFVPRESETPENVSTPLARVADGHDSDEASSTAVS